jgi:voltage-gated potassium channel
VTPSEIEATVLGGNDAVAPELRELSALVGWGAAAFYLAESDHNPAVQSYWDALHYVATSLSVGYANIFPVTAAGKIIGSIVMTFGPALTARVFERGAPLAAPAALELTPIVERLDTILAELRRINSAAPSVLPP